MNQQVLQIIIGSIKKEFNGNFNGLGYTIKNMYINENSEGNYCAGLFGYIGKNGKVQDIKLNDRPLPISEIEW